VRLSFENGWTGAQYSLLRALLGGYLALHFAALLSGSTGAPAAAQGLAAAGALAALCLAAGWRDRAAALLCGGVLACLVALDPRLASPSLLLVGGLLLLHAGLPGAPYGSWAGRDRIDPGAWRMPGAVYAAAWIALALGYTYGCTQPRSDFADLLPGLLLLHAFAFNPAWLAPHPAARGATVFYDGTCGLCHRFVRFVLAEDRAAHFQFAPLQGETFAQLAPRAPTDLPDSVVVRTPEGVLLTRSAGVLYVLAGLGGVWRAAAWATRWIPSPRRDAAYDRVAAVRRRVFTPPAQTCPLLPPHLRPRFLA
jgi:predicted DCC family thiol-disulfide oxidoreductase YuxK